MRRRDKRGQSFIEYAVLIGIVVGALIAMRIYMARSMQEKIRQTANVFGSGEQYEKGVTQVTDLDGVGIESPKETEVTYDTCPRVLRQVAGLEVQVEDLIGNADSLEQAAQDTQAQLQDLREQAVNMRSQAADFAAEAKGYRDQAAVLTAKADNEQAQIDKYKADCPGCFGKATKPSSTGTSCDDCASLITEVSRLETEITQLRQEAAEWNVKAEEKEDLARQLEEAADVLENEAIPQLQAQSERLRQEAEGLRAQAVGNEEEINRLKADSPECF